MRGRLAVWRTVPLLFLIIACVREHHVPAAAMMREVSLRCPVAGYVYAPGDMVPVAADARGFAAGEIVEFEVNGTIIARDASPPFETTLLIGKDERGSKRLIAIATGVDGLVTRSAPLDISVGTLPLAHREMTDSDILIADDPWQGRQPSVIIRTPRRGSVFCDARFVQLAADVRAVTAPVVRVDFEIDGKPIATLTKPPFTYSWKPIAGRHSAAVRATDAEGRVGVARALFLVVEPPQAHP